MGLDNNFILVWPDGNADGWDGMGSWNCSRTDGPLGPTCVLPRTPYLHEYPYPCYPSCPLCDPENSCDWSSCADDLGFIQHVVDEVTQQWYNHIIIWGSFLCVEKEAIFERPF